MKQGIGSPPPRKFGRRGTIQGILEAATDEWQWLEWRNGGSLGHASRLAKAIGLEIATRTENGNRRLYYRKPQEATQATKEKS